MVTKLSCVMSVKRRQAKSFGIQSGLDLRAASFKKSKFSLEKKLKMQIKKVTSKAAILKLMEDRLKALYDKEINALLSDRTSDIQSMTSIDRQQYIGADTVIAREMDDIITFASPRNQTEQLSVVCPSGVAELG